jgi:signal peptidase I
MNRQRTPLPDIPDESDTLVLPTREARLAAEKRQPSKVWSVLRDIGEAIVLVALIWVGVNFATARYIVEGHSMEPNLHSGQYLIVNRLTYQSARPQRGDIVVFDFPGDPGDGDDYVKRIIGVPGDTVIIDSHHIFVNGTLLAEPYLSADTITAGSIDYLVPEGNYFVLGDNRMDSSDSRAWGLLPQEMIVGKAAFSYWPPQSWGSIPHYDYGLP